MDLIYVLNVLILVLIVKILQKVVHLVLQDQTDMELINNVNALTIIMMMEKIVKLVTINVVPV